MELALSNALGADGSYPTAGTRSEEHTSELQSQSNLLCRLLLEKRKNNSTVAPTFNSFGCANHHVRLSSDASPQMRSRLERCLDYSSAASNPGSFDDDTHEVHSP